jgi:peptidoglycan/xylan/chitin deacetylase (PgdA/CDA1 family)
MLSLLLATAFATSTSYIYLPPEIDVNSNLSATSSKVIALTFDDGPYGTSTEKILAILRREHIKATFFVIGKNVEKYPQVMKDIVADGHVIGNHSYNHSKQLQYYSYRAFEKNLKHAESIIVKKTGLHPKFFRPPYGLMSKTMKSVLKHDGYTSIMWNVDPRDWDSENSSTTVEMSVLSAVKPGSIIILHDGHDIHTEYPKHPRENTINALEMLIDTLEKEGYTFVTLDTLLNKDAYKTTTLVNLKKKHI